MTTLNRITSQLHYLITESTLTDMLTRAVQQPEAEPFLWNYAPARLEALTARAADRQANLRGTAVIPVLGALDNEGYWGTSYVDIQNALAQATADPNVARIVLLIDSPGGEVEGIYETAEAIRAARVGGKKIDAVVTGTAASAAYWLASQADAIYLTPSGHVGSVGVISMHADITKLLDRMGVKITTFAAGKYKAEFSPFTSLTDEAKAHAQEVADGIYKDFLQAVTTGRGARAAASKTGNYGDGRLMNAPAAAANGLIDQVMTPGLYFVSLKTATPNYAARKAQSQALDFEL